MLCAAFAGSCGGSHEPPVPRLVASGVVSVPGSHEGPAAFDPVSGALYFTRAAADFSRSAILRFLASQQDSAVAAAFATGPYDAGVTFHPAEPTVVFTSQRQSPHPDIPDAWNLWSADVASTDARLLPFPVNTAASECCGSFAPDGSLLFSSNREGSWDVFRARPDASGGYDVSRLSGSINTEHDEWPSYVSPDGRLVLFSSIRPDGEGGDDVYAACLAGDPDRWQATRLGFPVNTDAYEDSAILGPDQQELYWSSRRPTADGGSDGNVFVIDVAGAGLPDCARQETGRPGAGSPD